jgi:micrococcal nuclease
LLALVLAGCAGEVAATPAPEPVVVVVTATPQDPAADQTATVLRVVDGDTIEVDIDGAVERLRYIGIDTPETNERCAGAATAVNEEVLGDGVVRLVPDEEDRDIYGRLLRYVYVGETFVNLELAERGVAVVMRIAPNTRHADEFKEAVGAAEKAGVGCLWDAELLAAEAAARAAATPTPEPTERIMVTNLHANAAGRDGENLNDEYVTIVNLGPDLEIGGWSLSDEADHRYAFADFTWATGVELRLHTGSGTDGDGVFYWGASSPIWNNTGDTLRLEDATGTQVLVYSYTD